MFYVLPENEPFNSEEADRYVQHEIFEEAEELAQNCAVEAAEQGEAADFVIIDENNKPKAYYSAYTSCTVQTFDANHEFIADYEV